MTEIGRFEPSDFHNRRMRPRDDGTIVVAYRDESNGMLKVDTGYSHATYNIDEVLRLGGGAEYLYDAGVEAIMRATHDASREALVPGTIKQPTPNLKIPVPL